MNQFHYTAYSQEVIFGAGALTGLGEAGLGAAVERWQWQRVMLCTSGSARRNGTVARVQAALGARLAAVYDCVQPHVQDFQVAEVLALGEQHRVDALIGLGGGSPVGMAKAVSLALEDKRAGQRTRPVSPTQQPLVPVIAIPTTYAGSEMTPVFGVTRHDGGTARKVTVNDARIAPKLVLYDPLLTLDLPPELTASSGINALAHCVEAAYSITRHPLSTAAALDGASHIAGALPRCFEAGGDVGARTEMQIGAHLAGLALASVAMGLHHGLCHVLGGTAGVPHAIANAIILPHAIWYNADACSPTLAHVAEAMGLARAGRADEALARACGQYVYDLAGAMHLPQHLRDAGVDERDLPRLAELAAQSRTVQNNPKPNNAPQIESILHAAW
jgi:maleylacetate reductase